MKFGLMTLLTVLSTSTLAGTLTNGTYKGHGKWNSPEKSGHYEVTTTVENDVIKTHYARPDGTTKDWEFKMVGDGKFFKVVVQGANIGQGYCLDEAPVCHYELNVGKLRLEETMTLQNGKFYRFGSKEDETGNRYWQEAME